MEVWEGAGVGCLVYMHVLPLRLPHIMKGTKVQTLGVSVVAGAYGRVDWAIIIIAMGAIINTHAHQYR